MIERVAWFSVCPQCGCHGVINLPDGTASPELYTKHQARQWVKSMADLQIDEHEAKALLEQIGAAEMCERDDYPESVTDSLRDLLLKSNLRERSTCVFSDEIVLEEVS